MLADRTSLAALTLALAAMSCAAAPEGGAPGSSTAVVVPDGGDVGRVVGSTDPSPVEPMGDATPDRAADAEPDESGIESSVELLTADGRTVAITYRDAAGAARTIRAQLRLPAADDADVEPLPVVVWSHGGSQGTNRVDRVGDRWGRAMTRDGVAFVAIAHAGRSAESRADICDAVGAVDCPTFNTLFWDRPHDLAVTLDWVESIAEVHGIGADGIVYAGHSAGATAVLTAAGMDWVFGSDQAPPMDPRPVAFIAASPPGVAARGLDESKLDGVDRPLLLLTGRGDTTNSTAAEDRIAIDGLLADGVATAVWIERDEARHGVFDLNTDPCERAGGDRDTCRALARAVAFAGVEFVAEVSAGGFDAAGFAGALAARLPDWATVS